MSTYDVEHVMWDTQWRWRMPSITVSEDVIGLIRALKRAGEKSDDETLRRILEHAKSGMKSRLRAFEAAEQDTSSTN